MLDRFTSSLQNIIGNNYAHKKYLLAVSGGADSSVMTELFAQGNLNFDIAHCNFHLRGEDSDRDMRFVMSFADKYHINVLVNEFNTFEIQKNSGKSIEMTARDLRYAWFEELLPNYDFLVTAHNSNDAAETQLLNIARGSVLKGLCSIPQKNGKIIRPMLQFSAKEIRNFAENNNILFVTDYTNSDESIRRNKIRHSVIPIFEDFNPNFLYNNAKNIQILQEQYSFYLENINKEIDEISVFENNTHKIYRNKLYNLLFPQLILHEIISKYGFTDDTCTKLFKNANIETGKMFHSDTHSLLVNRDFFIIKKNTDETFRSIINIKSFEELNKYFLVENKNCENVIVFDKNPNVFYIPEEKMQFPLQIRQWREGDYFYPLGAKGKQKLSDFFTNNKIDRFSKQEIKLLCKNDEIMWIIGYRSDERFKINKSTKKYYKITYLRNNEK